MQPDIVIKTAFLTLLFIIVPGLSLTLALFPKKDGITVVERGGLAMVLGICPALLVYFLDKNLQVAFSTGTSLAAYLAVTAAGFTVYSARKSRLKQ